MIEKTAQDAVFFIAFYYHYDCSSLIEQLFEAVKTKKEQKI